MNKFNSLNRGVRLPLTEFLSKVDSSIFTIILFGSALKKKETKKSDIDILIVANEKKDYNNIKKEVDAKSNYPLNIFQCNINDLKERKDHIIKQAVNTGFPIKGEQNFYKVLLE